MPRVSPILGGQAQRVFLRSNDGFLSGNLNRTAIMLTNYAITPRSTVVLHNRAEEGSNFKCDIY